MKGSRMNQYFLAVASDFISQDEIASIIETNSKYLDNLNCEQIDFDQLLEVDQLYYFVITGGTEQQILDLHQKRYERFGKEESVLLAHASHNSLPAALEVLAKFQQDGEKGRIVYLPEAETNLNVQHNQNIKTFAVKETLSGQRIGLIGEPSDWLVASKPSFKAVKQSFGIDVIPIDLNEIKELITQTDSVEIDLIKSDLIKNSIRVFEPSDQEIDDNVRVYLAMKAIIKKYKLNAVTIRCFDLVLDLKTTGCFALSRLNDEGIIAGCEGDLVSTIGMMWTQKKFGKLPWMANPAQINLKENSLILAHCTVPRSLVSSYKLRSHFESGLGVGIQGEFPLQKVTLIRLGGKNMEQIWQVEGEIIQTGNAENLCRTQIKVKLDVGFSVQDLLTNPLGNHLVVVNSPYCPSLNKSEGT
jgi:L-fucose isomerase-like protein